MKKILFLLLCTVTMYGQTYQNPTYGTVTSKTNATSTTATKVNVQETDGKINIMSPENIPVDISPQPINYNITDTKLGSHLKGIDNKFGSLVQTTAGVTNRIWFTGDISVVNAVNYFTSSAAGKGAVTGASPTPLVNNDDQKKYFTQDIIGIAFPSLTKFPAGTYAGNLSVRVSPNSASQRYTVEIYKTNNLGVPIASGITGAPVGDLGVTVVVILDSGLINLADNSITNIPVNGILSSQLTINTNERIRYHVSAAKVGTSGANITMEAFYGSNYNSFYDVPVNLDTNGVKDVSTVTNGAGTATDALNNLKSSIPVNYSKIVYVNSTSPNTATIFDVVNPPVTNNNALKSDVANLYIASDNSGWVYNSELLTYVTKIVTSQTSNFYLFGTTTDAGNTKTASVERVSNLPIGSYSMYFRNQSSGRALGVLTSGSGDSYYSDNAGVGHGFVSNATLSGTGFLFLGRNNGVPTYSVDKLGAVTGVSFTKSGATGTNILLAGGSDIPQSTFLTGAGTTGQVSFWNGTATQGGDNALFWDNTNKRLGIGTQIPDYILSVGVKNGIDGNILMSAAGNANNAGSSLLWDMLVAGGNSKSIIAKIQPQSNGSGNALNFHVGVWNNNNDSGSAKMTILSTGNVGIGVIPTTTATDKLQVNGNITANAATAANHVVIKSQLDAVRPYKVYTALLSQTGTNAPTATVLENSLGGTIVWARSSSGVYLGTLSGVFTANKTVAFAQLGAEVTGIDYAGGWDISVKRNSTSVMQIRLHSNGTASDELNTSIEIRVYP